MSSSVLNSPKSVVSPAPQPAEKDEPQLRDLGDATALRTSLYDSVLNATRKLPPIANKRHTLRLANVDYADKGEFSYKQQKDAILGGKSLNRRIRGTWQLVDNETGETIEQKDATVAHVPYMTNRGTMIYSGNEYTLSNQMRLRSGIYTRIKGNGEIEAHANIIPGQGTSHRYFLDPEKGIFKIRIGQANIPLMPMLRSLGATDKQLREAWGQELFFANAQKDDPAALNKIYKKLVRSSDPDADTLTKQAAIAKAINAMEMDPDVNELTLAGRHDRLGLDSILATTRKLLAVSRGEQDVDDRDNLTFQTIHGPEDLFSERLLKDYGGLQRQLLQRASFNKNLRHIGPGALSKQLEAAILNSGLGQPLEEINMAEILDKQSKVSRLGEGGIPSVEVVPDDARSVQPSYLSFIDPVRTPESFKLGVDSYIANTARKGSDGRIYSPLLDAKTGKEIYRSPQDIADSTVAFPGSFKSKAKRVAAMRGGKLGFFPRDEVDYIVPHFENAFSPLGSMIPMKSAVKAQRMAMASRMLTQALPLDKPEAPLVQTGMPGEDDKSYEEHYGSKMGAIRADKGGRVIAISPNEIKVKYDDGTTENKELYENWPFNRKTFVHNTPAVKPGDVFRSGDLLARSNYTDEKGTTALGKNARVAYIPFRGLNFEDAIVISESFAKRMSSEHMYQNSIDVTDEHKVGKKNFIGLFPGKYNREILSKLDDDGVVPVGTKIHYDEPLILAAKQRELGKHKIHRKREASYNDATVTWKHHSPGVVTDVYKGPKGTTVLVKAMSPMQVGDKMSGRYGDKGVLADIIPDREMPHGEDGKPYEVLLNPLGVISRCYDDQTEFLTQRGWRRGQDVADTDQFYEYDTTLGTLRTARQLAKFHVADYDGPMYYCSATHMDFAVTPGHTMWSRCDYPDAAWQKVPVERITGHRWWVPTVGDVVPGVDTDFLLPPVNTSAKDTQSNKELVKIPARDFAEFLGWYLTEGHTDHKEPRAGKCSEYKVFIAQDEHTNPGNCESIAELLDKLPFNWYYKNSTQQFVISDKRLAHYCYQFGLCDQKYVDPWLFTLSAESRAAFLATCWAGDGLEGETTTDKVKTIGLTSEQLIDDIQRLSILNGVAAIKRAIQVRKGDKPMWRCVIQLKKRDRMLCGRHWEERHYSGKVYCPTVSTGYVLTRRNGKILIAGNTNPAQMIESILGKIAAKTGKRYAVKDFEDIDDLVEFAIAESKKHGVQDLERIIDPTTDQAIDNIFTGNRFFMKLHHTAESKGAGRGTGGYTSEGAPAKGGESGCFVGTQMVMTAFGKMSIANICEKRLSVPVLTFCAKQKEWLYRPITDWFTYRAPVTDVIKIFVNGPTLENQGNGLGQHTDHCITTTKQHVFYTSRGEQTVAAGTLQVGDQLTTWGVSPSLLQKEFLLGTVPMPITRIEPYTNPEGEQEVNVYDFTVAETHKYCAGPALVSNSKRVGLMDNNALLSHGATEVARDAGSIRGQRNEEFWLPFLQGKNPPPPRVPMMYEKFVNQLKSAGINVIQDGYQTHIMALTDKDINTMAGNRFIRSGETVRFEKGLEPVKGGLFDEHLTGGHSGTRWSAIKLAEPMPNPVMEEPIRRILGVTGNKFSSILAGREPLGNFGTGPDAIARALSKIDVDRALEQCREQIKSGRKTQRDEAIRKLGYLKSCKRLGIHPGDWVLTQVPVLPPKFRPVTTMSDKKLPLVDDANFLYKELLEANDNLKEMRGLVDDTGDERLAVYSSFKAVTGLGDPVHPKLQTKRVRGVLQHIFGSSPKYGTIQSRLLSSTVDLVGRAVITPNPDLDMDHVGLPENHAWDVYRQFVVRRLKQRGMPIVQAMEQVKNRTAIAREEMLKEMADRPVIINRAPVLHRFGMMAFYPKLVKGDTLQISPLVVGGFNADFDGDAMQYHVPVSREARDEAIEKMLPSRNLLSPADFKQPMYKPTQEYTGGLYAASTHKTKIPPKRFRSKADVIAAYRRGELRLGDPVEILN